MELGDAGIIKSSFWLFKTKMDYEEIVGIKIARVGFVGHTIEVQIRSTAGKCKKYRFNTIDLKSKDMFLSGMQERLPLVPVTIARPGLVKRHLMLSVCLLLMVICIGLNIYYEITSNPTITVKKMPPLPMPTNEMKTYSAGDLTFELPDTLVVHPEPDRTGMVLIIDRKTGKRIYANIQRISKSVWERNEMQLDCYSSVLGITKKAARKQIGDIKSIYKLDDNGIQGFIFLELDNRWPKWQAEIMKNDFMGQISLVTHFDRDEALEILRLLVKTAKKKAT
jgi:hypothetical protein